MTHVLAASGCAAPPAMQVASTNDIDLERVCRICLQDAPDLRSIFDHPDNIPEVVRTVAQLEVSTEDTLPKQICSRCVGRVETVVDFRNKCIQSYQRLAEYVSAVELYAAGAGSGSEAMVEFVKIEIVDTRAVGGEVLLKEDGVDSSGSEEITVQLDADGEVVATSAGNESENSFHDNTKEEGRRFPRRTARYTRNQKVIPRAPADSGTTSCPLCNERFSSKMLMKYHVKSDHADDDGAEKVRRCFFCPKAYSTYQLLSYHLYFHPQKVWQCPECSKGIAKKSKFMDHLRMHANERHYECTICDKRFTTMKYLSIHRQTHRRRADQGTRQTDRNTPSDDDSSIDEDETEDLKTPVLADESNICLVCDETFQRSHLLQYHLKSEHVPYDASEAQAQQCHVCSREFVTSRQLQMHMHLHAGRVWSCPDCKERFRKLSNYNEHRRIHFNGRSNLCVYCGKEFLTAKYLNRHLQTHTKNEAKRKQEIYECEICGKQMKYKSNYTNHRKTHGMLCSKPPTSPEPDGGQKKVYLCNICGRDCGSSSNLTVHIRRHNGQSVCQCSVCGKGFPRRADMVMHMRKHTGEKPYECPTCGRGFSRRDKLRIHIRIHTGEKPYGCPCGRAYAQKNDLKTHQKRNSCGQNFDLSKLMAPHQTTICVNAPPASKPDGSENFRRKSGKPPVTTDNARIGVEGPHDNGRATLEAEPLGPTAYSLPMVEFCEPA